MKLAVVSLPFPNEKTWESQFSLQLVLALSQVGHDVSVFTRATPTTVASIDSPRVQVFKVFQKQMLGDCQRMIETMMRLRPEKLLLVVDKKFDLKWSSIFLTLFATAQAIGCGVFVITHNQVLQTKLDELRLSPLLVQAGRVFSAFPSKNYPWFELDTSLVGLQSSRKADVTSVQESSKNIFVFGKFNKRPRGFDRKIEEILALENLKTIYLAFPSDVESLFKHLVLDELRRKNLLSKVEFVPNLDFETCDKVLSDCTHLVVLDDLSAEKNHHWIIGMAASKGLSMEAPLAQQRVGKLTIDEMTNSILREITAPSR